MDKRKFLPFIITGIILIFAIKIINSSLTNELLKMRNIEATTSMANSSHDIGSGDSGLPLILENN